MELPKLDPSVPDEAAEMLPHFFTGLQFAVLSKVCDMIMPPIGGRPGALEAGAPQFLDFLIGESLADRKEVYLAGLDSLDRGARKRFKKSFTDLDAKQADELLAPLRGPWTYGSPVDPVARFLRVAKADVRIGSAQSGPKVAAILSVVESCRRLRAPVTQYLSDMLPGMSRRKLADVAHLTPAKWAASR